MLFVFLLFIVIFLSGNGRVYGQCNTVSLQIIDQPACEGADPNQNCQVESSKTTYNCWLENGKCVTDYYWTGCYDENVDGTLQCVFHSNLVKIDCDNPPGQGGGGGFNWFSCPDWTWLTCGTTSEADAQNKYACTNRAYCDNYFSPELIGAECAWNNAGDPTKWICQSNCSCCPTGSYRSCTQGSQYTVDVRIELPLDEAGIAAKVSCVQWHGHDDIFVSNDCLPIGTGCNTYENRWGDEFQDWQLTCIHNDCGCATPPTPTPPAPKKSARTSKPRGTIFAAAT